jgi:hypothetical protein
VIECDSAARAEVLYVAVPLLSEPVPMVVFPSLKVTVPPAVEGATVAVKVTDAPTVDGFAEEATVVVVFAWFTVCVSVDEALPLSFESPA